VAYQFQIEEYQRDLEAERESHKRTKAKSESLDQQRNTLLQALNAKKKEVGLSYERKRAHIMHG